MTLLQVSAKFVVPVEAHVTARLVAVEEGAVVLLEVAAAITCTKVDGIAAWLRTEETTVGKFHDYCVKRLEGLSKWQQRSDRSRITGQLSIELRLDRTRIEGRDPVPWDIQSSS